MRSHASTPGVRNHHSESVNDQRHCRKKWIGENDDHRNARDVPSRSLTQNAYWRSAPTRNRTSPLGLSPEQARDLVPMNRDVLIGVAVQLERPAVLAGVQPYETAVRVSQVARELGVGTRCRGGESSPQRVRPRGASRPSAASLLRANRLASLDDAATISIGDSRLALTTDSCVVTPPVFPGGDIGSPGRTARGLPKCGAASRLFRPGRLRVGRQVVFPRGGGTGPRGLVRKRTVPERLG